jgi:hypothetical protein
MLNAVQKQEEQVQSIKLSCDLIKIQLTQRYFHERFASKCGNLDEIQFFANPILIKYQGT